MNAIEEFLNFYIGEKPSDIVCREIEEGLEQILLIDYPSLKIICSIREDKDIIDIRFDFHNAEDLTHFKIKYGHIK